MYYAIANTVLRIRNGAAVVITFIWDLVTNQWQDETRTWN
jgi:hypothetical protein